MKLLLPLLLLPSLALADSGPLTATGWRWVDSDEPAGPSMEPDTDAPLPSTGLCGDEWFTFAIGFDFPFQGLTYP